MESSFVVCDLETTGLNPYADKIIEIGLVRVDDGKLCAQYHTLVNPNQALDIKIKRLTGLDDGDLAGAPVLAEVLPEVVAFIGDRAIAGHNVDFDLSFLNAARGEPFRNQIYDTLELARLVAPESPGFRLGALCQAFQIELPRRHRALDDAVATAHLLNVLIERMRRIDLNVLVPLSQLLAEAHSKWHHLASEMVRELLRVFPDRKIAAVPYWRREDAEAEKKGSREQPKASEKQPLDQEYLAALAGPEGPLGQTIAGYEYRPQQEMMTREVAGAFNEGKYLLIEAGTGVGKSIAYLLPAVLWSVRNKERVVVATNTINLQEQLWSKDIPVLAGVINEPFRASLAKGRQNYLCLRRWLNALNGTHQPPEAAFYARVLTWLTATPTGDRAGLNIAPAEGDYWLNICGDAESCLGVRCRYLRDCFVQKARKAVEESDLVITNHSLLFSDVKAENRVLPAYGPLIIDEAHHLEDSATTHLGRQVSLRSIYRWLGVCGRTLAQMADITPPEDREKWREKTQAALAARLETAEAVRLFLQLCGKLAAGKTAAGDFAWASGRATLRLPDDTAAYEQVVAQGAVLVELLAALVETLQTIAAMLEIWSISTDEWMEPARDLLQIVQSGFALTEDLRFILDTADENFVYWAEFEFAADNALKSCSLFAAPVNIGPVLYEKFYRHKSTIVFTSATLSVKGTFDHFVERTGLDYLPAGQLARVQLDSPFAYERQALLCISRDLPAQGTVPADLYLEKIAAILTRLITVTGGKTLVLFTSHKMLRETYQRVKPGLESMDIYLLGQGIDGGRSRILEEFRGHERAVLFGASSFWEGVDVPGQALTCVIMVKLPFGAPSSPVIEARLEDLARRQKDGFRALSIPQAVIRFKQGFGRLIRSSSDRGCVVILDRRILDKNYGRQFLGSLPLKNHVRGETELIARKLSEWLSGGGEKTGTFGQAPK